MNFANNETKSNIEINGNMVRLSDAAREYQIVDDIAVTLLTAWSDEDIESFEEMGIDMSHKKPPFDFEIENPFRNVVGFDESGSHRWTIPEAPDPVPEEPMEPFYLNLWESNDEIWARNKNQRAYRIDPASGEIVESLPADRLRIADREIELDGGWVKKVLHFDDMVAVLSQPANHPDPDGRNLYVFDEDGTERWWIGDRLEGGGPDAPPLTNIWLEDGDLHAYATDGYEYRFNPDDGTLLGQEWVK